MNDVSAELFETARTKKLYKKFTQQMKNKLKELVQDGKVSRNKACRQLEIAPSTGKKYLQQALPLPLRRSRSKRSPVRSQQQSITPSQVQQAAHEVEEHHEHSTLIQQTSTAYWIPIPSETIIFYWY